MHYKVKTEGQGMEPVHRYWVPDLGPARNEERVLTDLRHAREAIRRHLRHDPRLLAWPYGFANGRLDSLARESGFEATFSLSPGAARPEDDPPWHIPRFTITARTTVGQLAEMVDQDRARRLAAYGDDRD
jgi:peptidoglycan/xylan/chitin deacetylase (PgdA/CDA1 family)